MLRSSDARLWLGLAALLFAGFSVATFYRTASRPPLADRGPQVVVPAVIQVALYGGDRFLAASVESVRAAASGDDLDGREGGYRLRAHRVVSQLNPCHQDNYWVGNASLSFGGAVDAGSELLGRASQCRFWDEFPPFLYGFNLRFFRQDAEAARKAIELAADRAPPSNAPGLRQIAILLKVNAIKDARAAMAMLKEEHDNSRDPNLRELLAKRVQRMNGLVLLREAQATYEQKFGTRLDDPRKLLESRILAAFPLDPMMIGYEFRGGTFHLQQLRVDGFN